jgi:hypothetical protein
MLRNAHKLKSDPRFPGVYIRPSDLKSNRIELARLKKDEPNEKYVIYRDRIIKLADLPSRRSRLDFH